MKWAITTIILTLFDFGCCVKLAKYLLINDPYTWSFIAIMINVFCIIICTYLLIDVIVEQRKGEDNHNANPLIWAKNYDLSLAIIATLLCIIAVEMYIKIGY